MQPLSRSDFNCQPNGIVTGLPVPYHDCIPELSPSARYEQFCNQFPWYAQLLAMPSPTVASPQLAPLCTPAPDTTTPHQPLNGSVKVEDMSYSVSPDRQSILSSPFSVIASDELAYDFKSDYASPFVLTLDQIQSLRDRFE